MSVPSFNNKNILVLGFAMTGQSVAEFLLNQGAKVTINDQGDLKNQPLALELEARGAHLVGSGHPLELLNEGFDFIVKTPGIPYQIPFLQAAMLKGIPIYTDVELASWVTPAELIGVTGSNGKTTITSLLHHIMQLEHDQQTFLAGNIGIPSLQVAQTAQENDRIVMELSSFQLMGTEYLHPHIAVIANIYEAHLDYHGDRAHYIAAKLRLIANMTANDYLVYDDDEGELRELLQPTLTTLVPYAREKVTDWVRQHGAYQDGEGLYFKGEQVATVTDLQIPGDHNILNALAVIAVSKLEDIPNALIRQGLKTYYGMPYRIQKIAEEGGRVFYNDSKATNTTATKTALHSFQQPITYIGGGLDRGVDFMDLRDDLQHVRQAYLYGESKELMAHAFRTAGVPAVVLFDTLKEAATAAYQSALSGEVVLFSPACASWDQYQNYEVRGEEFTLVIQHCIEEE